MKTLYLLLLVAAAISTAAALPPLGSAVAAGAGSGLEDEYEDYAILDDEFYADDNSTDSTDGPGVSTDTTDDLSTGSTDFTDDWSSNSTDYTDDPSNSTDITSPDSTPTTDGGNGGNDDDEGLSGGAIAGIVIGSVAGVALIAGGVYFMMKKEMLCFGS